MLWHKLNKHFLQTIMKPKTKDELIEGITRFCGERRTVEKCCKNINHLQKIFPIVIELDSCASGHKPNGSFRTITARLGATKFFKSCDQQPTQVRFEKLCFIGKHRFVALKSNLLFLNTLSYTVKQTPLSDQYIQTLVLFSTEVNLTTELMLLRTTFIGKFL